MIQRILIALAVIIAAVAVASQEHHDSEKHHGRIVFETFPTDEHFYQADVAPHVRKIIEEHGPEEWKAVVLTTEFHTHLGIYAIVGAKMGMRARDYFDAGVDEIRITSFAGNKPPVSCLNDGLQASTGATLGHGTITVPSTDAPTPKAHFTHDGRTICLEMKPACRKQAAADIKRLVEQYGLEDDRYWDGVRELGIRYWLTWDRHEMFDVTVVPTKSD